MLTRRRLLQYLAPTFISMPVLCRQSHADLPAQPLRPQQTVLIVYISRTNNTRVVAEIIQTYTGGDLLQLTLQDPYPVNYQANVDQVDSENKRGLLPTLATRIPDLGHYQYIFLGFPTWDMQLPPPMKSFLANANLAGKKLHPFNTHAGYGLGASLSNIRERAPNSHISPAFSVEGGFERRGVFLAIQGQRKQQVEKQLLEWIKTVGMV